MTSHGKGSVTERAPKEPAVEPAEETARIGAGEPAARRTSRIIGNIVEPKIQLAKELEAKFGTTSRNDTIKYNIDSNEISG